MSELKKIELLAPARDLETGRVAVDCGADAVYIGGPGFGARHAAGNSIADIAALVAYARPFGVRVYATMNTLLFDDEIADAKRVAQSLLDAGVDALIVQDMAFLRMGLTGPANPVSPANPANFGIGTGGAGVEFHASTQTSNIVPAEIRFLGRAGFRRVVLERALSIDEIREIRAACDDETEIEAFVHGAICVGFSGRCFMSRALRDADDVSTAASGELSGGAEKVSGVAPGGAAMISGGAVRSGNRGSCSQPCRLAYDLKDGSGAVLARGKHLLSLRDLDLSARLGELLDAGVTSLKIEGRLKDAAYVRNVVSHYRRLLDVALAARPGLTRASVGHSEPDFRSDPAKSFTRGATEYFFDGAVGGVASFDTPKAMGERVGKVEKTGCERTGNHFFALKDRNIPASGSGLGGTRNGRDTALGNGHGGLQAGDGICFFVNGELRGTNLNRVDGARIYPNRIDGIAAGTEIFRNYDHAFARTLERSKMSRKIDVSAIAKITQCSVNLLFMDSTGVSVDVCRNGEFDSPRDPGKMEATLRSELSRSGGTIFNVNAVEVAGEVRFVPVSVLAELRREGLQRLLETRQNLPPERNPAVENVSEKLPRTTMTAAENVTNRLSECFWRDHGVTEIESAQELRPAVDGDAVMRTRYCVRRETGKCLRSVGAKNGSSGGDAASGVAKTDPARTELFLERGREKWRLEFDCARCEMVVRVVRPRQTEVAASAANRNGDGKGKPQL